MSFEASVDTSQWTESLSFDIVDGKVSKARAPGHWVKVLLLPAGHTFNPDGNSGVDERARVIVTLEKGQWKLLG